MDTSPATTLSPNQSQALANLKAAWASTQLGNGQGQHVAILSTVTSAGETQVARQFVEFLKQEGHSALTLTHTGKAAHRLALQFPQPVMTLTGYHETPPDASVDCLVVLDAEQAAPAHLKALAEQSANGLFVVLAVSKEHLGQVVGYPWASPMQLTALEERFRQVPLA